ncbi:MAG: hypothetical protein IJZ85_03680 [Lachnospiraceae bacterium]|nr:hypothetical protein [Lachnospiraceae bacterium]
MKRVLLFILTICMLGTMVGCAGGEKEKKVTRGTIEGEIYTSEFAGVTFTKPENWVYSTDEEIAQVMNVGAEIMDRTEFEKKAMELTTIYDMMVKDPMWGNNISISFENLQMNQASNITVDQYINTVQTIMVEQASVMNYEFGETVPVKLGEQEYSRMSAIGSYSGVSFEQYIYLRKEGVYMIVITVSVFDGTAAGDFEAMFQ